MGVLGVRLIVRRNEKYKKLVHDQKIMHLSKRKFSTETKRKMRRVINMYDDCQKIRVSGGVTMVEIVSITL